MEVEIPLYFVTGFFSGFIVFTLLQIIANFLHNCIPQNVNPDDATSSEDDTFQPHSDSIPDDPTVWFDALDYVQ